MMRRSIMGKLVNRLIRFQHRERPRRIRILGWYGFHSTGDDLLKWCIEHLFRERAALRNLAVEFTDGDDCDLCVVGGGTIIGCDTSDICRRAKRIRAPLAIFGPGFRNTGHEHCRHWQPEMKALFDRAVAAGVRGPRTALALATHAMAQNVTVVGDPAVGFEPIPLPWRPDTPTVGVCIREMKNADKGLEERYASTRDTFNKFAAIIPRVLETLRAELVFLSFAENQFDSDANAARHLREMLPPKYKTASILPYSDDVRLNPSITGQLDYLISERMHPAIIAWLAGKPCLMLENQYGKSTDFMESIDMGAYCLRTDQLSTDGYMDLFNKLMWDRHRITRSSDRAFKRLKEKQENFVDALVAHLL